jgi:hypothetical protein
MSWIRLDISMFVLASGHWYSSNGFGILVSVAVAVVAIIVSVILWRFGVPRAVLEYSKPVSKSLISSDLPAGRLQLMLDEKPVASPHVVTLTLVNKGRRDIRSSDFDQRRPIILDLGVKIIDILNLADLEFVDMLDQQATFGPALIRGGQRITIDLLVDGKPNLQVRQSLADVKVRPQRPGQVTLTILLPIWGTLSGLTMFGLGILSALAEDTGVEVFAVVMGFLFIIGSFAAAAFYQARNAKA